MHLEVLENDTLAELQEKFRKCFPGLSLEFYSKAHSWHGRSLPKQNLDNSLHISQITKKHEPGVLIINWRQKAGDIEKAFKNQFGLFAQVCYKSGTGWIETADTDDVTLRELAAMAAQLNLQ